MVAKQFFGKLIASLSKCLFMYIRKTSKNDLQIFYFDFYLIKELQKCCLATVAKENDFGIASISENDQYVLKYICANFHHKLRNCGSILHRSPGL